MQTPLISVVVPCFNGAEFLQPCVDSILSQNCAAEVIIVDDGSTDDSLNHARDIARAHPDRIMIVAQANRGQADARNAGIRVAAGKYLGFLDVDDEYAAGFLVAAANVLEKQPSIAAVEGKIEFVDLHRPVEPWQREAMESTMPGTILLRTDTARQIGGFPVDPAFRGAVGGEDGCFRVQLALFGDIAKLPSVALKYRVRQGSHFDFFLDRAVFHNGAITFKESSTQELDGTFAQAVRQYKEDVAIRMMARLTELVHTESTAVANFLSYQNAFKDVPGLIEPLEAFAVYTLAKRWPMGGYAVEIGGAGGRSTCWLAAGSKASGCGKVAVIEPSIFPVASQPTGSSPDKHAAATALRRTIELLRLSDAVQIFEDVVLDLRTQWREPIRMLLLDSTSSRNSKGDFDGWSPLLARHGLLALHGNPASPATKSLANALHQSPVQWSHLFTIRHLAVFQKGC